MGKFAIPEPFAWDASFDVQHAETNLEHQNLFTKINTLAGDMHNAAKTKDLVDYVVLHFKNEEARMLTMHGFHGFDEHKAIHDKFLADVGAVKEINAGVIAFLKEWLVNHIKGHDQADYAGKLH